MTSNADQLSPIDPAVISPGFVNPVCNAVADGDLDYLHRQLVKHHFVIHELPGAEMYDAHGFRFHLSRVLQAPDGAFGIGGALVPDWYELFAARAARRVALVVRDADRLIESDIQRAMTLIESAVRDAERLRSHTPPTQLLIFIVGPAPAFRPVEPSARRRAEAQRGPRALASEIGAKAWSKPAEFDLRPHHQFTISNAAWYYASLGRRATSPEERWHCVECDDTITFYRAADAAPCIAGTFARTTAGMQLVGVRYESDEGVYHFPWDGEDPFTLFRRLCEWIERD